MLRRAVFDETRRFRYLLVRDWRGLFPAPMLTVCMLNPSTADENVDDPTVRRVIGFARRRGYGGVEVVNAFALRSTDPKLLYSDPSPVGPLNDKYIVTSARRSFQVLVAWGKHGAFLDRAREVATLLLATGKPIVCLGRNKDGSPCHPLYLPDETPFEAWDASAA